LAICIAEQLAIALVLIAFSDGPWQLAIIAISIPLAILSAVVAFLRHRASFSLFSGLQLIFQCCACVLGTGLGYAGAWSALGLGLVCILIGNQALLSSQLYVGVKESGLSSKGIVSATFRSFWRILFFMAIVMVSSLLVLFLILAMDIGSLTLPFLLVAGLLAMISLYYLATRGAMAGDEEKPNI
jgi:hypothetical protein